MWRVANQNATAAAFAVAHDVQPHRRTPRGKRRARHDLGGRTGRHPQASPRRCAAAIWQSTRLPSPVPRAHPHPIRMSPWTSWCVQYAKLVVLYRPCSDMSYAQRRGGAWRLESASHPLLLLRPAVISLCVRAFAPAPVRPGALSGNARPPDVIARRRGGRASPLPAPSRRLRGASWAPPQPSASEWHTAGPWRARVRPGSAGAGWRGVMRRWALGGEGGPSDDRQLEE